MHPVVVCILCIVCVLCILCVTCPGRVYRMIPFLQTSDQIVVGPKPATAYIPFDRSVDIHTSDMADIVESAE